MSLLIKHFYRFGKFSLDADQKIVLREGKPLPLAPKVFDTLLILVQNSGRILEKDELMNRVWPDTFVEESNLTYNIQQLRKSLGDNAREPLYIETIPRRGYRFIASVEEILSDSSPDSKIEARESEVAVEVALESHVNKEKLDVKVTSRKLSITRVATAAAIIIILVGGGLVLLKFSTKSSGGINGAGGLLGAPVPLKLEKLTGTGESRLAAISPDGKYIAYTRNFEKKSSVWLRQLATNTNVEIVPATSRVHGLAFGNGGEYLYFVKGDPTALYRISLLGGVPTKLVDNLEGNFSVSSDDSQIAFVRERINQQDEQEYSLMIANSDGKGQRALLVSTHPNDLGVPVWSPDSRSVICAYGSSVSGSQDVTIVEVTIADGTKKQLSSERFFHIAKMAWLPDRSGIILAAWKHFGENSQLWRLSYPDLEMRQITEGLISYADLSLAAGADKAVASQMTSISDIWVGASREPRTLKKITQAMDNFCWTPSGQLVYLSMASGNEDLWIMQPDGTGQRQLTVDVAVDGTPAVTSDNRYIVFISNRTGSFQVWRMDLDGSNQIQLTSGAAKNFPAVSSDAKWVLYNTTDDWHLWRVSIDGGEPSQLSDYPARYPSVSPDGKMIAGVERIESTGEVLIFPFEGGQPLKKIDLDGRGFSGIRIQWTADSKNLIYAAEESGATAIFKQPLEGGPSHRIVDYSEYDLFDFGYSVDGRLYAVTRGGWQHDVVLISDLSRH